MSTHVISIPKLLSARYAAVYGAVGFSLGWLMLYFASCTNVFLIPLALAMPGGLGCYALSKWIPGNRTRVRAMVGYTLGFAGGTLLIFLAVGFTYWIFPGPRSGGIVTGTIGALILFVLAPGACFGFAGFLGGIALEDIQPGAARRSAKSFFIGGSIGGLLIMITPIFFGPNWEAGVIVGSLGGMVPFAVSGALFGRELARATGSADGAVSTSHL